MHETLSSLEALVYRILLIPPQPHPPEGSPGSIQVFRAGRNYYRWRVLMWFITNASILVTTLAVHAFLEARVAWRWPETGRAIFYILEIAALVGFAATAAFSFISQRLNYLLRWYIVTDRSLRIRGGILAIHELTMTYSNIQEIRVTAGPLQNALGLADVEVHSAGGGAAEKGMTRGHIGKFAGLDNANEIRDLIVERLRQYRDSGLGEVSPNTDLTTAARQVLDEARALRATLTAN